MRIGWLDWIRDGKSEEDNWNCWAGGHHPGRSPQPATVRVASAEGPPFLENENYVPKNVPKTQKPSPQRVSCGVVGGKRRGRDSNPRRPQGLTGFRDRLLQPLGHLSQRRIIEGWGTSFQGCYVEHSGRDRAWGSTGPGHSRSEPDASARRWHAALSDSECLSFNIWINPRDQFSRQKLAEALIEGSATRHTRAAMANLAACNVQTVLAGDPPITPVPR